MLHPHPFKGDPFDHLVRRVGRGDRGSIDQDIVELWGESEREGGREGEREEMVTLGDG